MSLSKLLQISGLTKYQTDLFTAIIKNPDKSAKELSKLTKVPLGRIYTELESLEKQQLIDIGSRRPKSYFIKNPQEKIMKLVESEKEKLDSIERKAFEEFVSINKKSSEVYHTSPEIRKSQIDCFKWAQKEVCQCLGDLHKASETKELKAIYEKEIIAAVEQGVIFRALYQKGDTPPKVISKLQKNYPSNFLIRYSNIPLPRFDIIDSNQILLKIQDPANSINTLGTVIINNINLAKKLRIRFMNLWEEATTSK